MRNKIVMISHNTHSFLKNEIQYAAECFKTVIVICPSSIEITEVCDKYKNIRLYTISKRDLYVGAICSLINVFSKEVMNEIIDARKCKLLSPRYFKMLLAFLSYKRIVLRYLAKIIKLPVEKSKDYVFYSAWYYGTAYAISKSKEKYKDAKIVSLAHSFEVDEEKNKHIRVLFRKYYHNKLDRVSFISKNVCNDFRMKIAKPLGLNEDNVTVDYLGTRKHLEGLSKFSNDKKIRVLSCSHVVPIKRVNKIFECLNNYRGKDIEWTHIGDGECLEEIRDIVKNDCRNHLSVKLLGSIPNKLIHKYYLDNCVDVFINLSLAEGIPVTIMEALAYGVPTIATDVGGNSEIVKEEFGRIISKDFNQEDFNSALEDIINISNSHHGIQDAAYSYYHDNFDSDIMRREFFNSLRQD